MARLTTVVLALAFATPAFADYEAGFGYPVHSAPRYGKRSYQLPRREVTTIERTGNRTRIETKRYYRDGGTARMKTSSGAWSARSR